MQTRMGLGLGGGLTSGGGGGFSPNYYVANDGSDSNDGRSPSTAWATISKAFDDVPEGSDRTGFKRGDVFAITVADQQIGNISASGLPRSIGDYGSTDLAPPLLDARQDLSGKTWTLLTGSAWETTVTLQTAPVTNGVEQSQSSKFAMHFADEDEIGDLLSWKTGGANVAANDAAVAANPGSFGINIVGSTAGDIRATGSTSTSARLVVHLPDGSDPNGKPLKLSDRGTVATFHAGRHGNLRFVGGGQKDAVSFTIIGTTFPTVASIESIGAGGHGMVAIGINVTGRYKAHLRPVEGESTFAKGRTLCGGLTLYTGTDFSPQSPTFGSIDVANATDGLFVHGNANNYAYQSVIINGRSTITNCQQAVATGSGPSNRVGILREGVKFNGGLDIVGGDTAFALKDDPQWYINGGSWTSPSTAVLNQLITNLGQGGIHIKDFTFAMTTTLGRHLYSWKPSYGHSGSNTPPTYILDNVTDESVIGGGYYKATMFAVATGIADDARVDLDLRNGTTLGDLWGASTSLGFYPNSIVADDSGVVFGIGGKRRHEIKSAMALLGRTCTLPDSVGTVNHLGAVVSVSGVAENPTAGSERIVNGGFDADTNWTKGTGWTISGGVLNSNNASGFNAASQGISGLSSGGAFRVSLTVTRTSGTLKVRLGNGIDVLSLTSSGTFTIDITRASGGSNLFELFAWGGFVGTVDNVSLLPLTY